MLAGHETTAKSVGTLPTIVHSLDVVLIDPSADLCALGVGQAPQLPGETPGGD